MKIPFPFGVEEGCFANERFRLNCTEGNLTVCELGKAQYHVTAVSLDDGTLTVGNMMNDTNYEKEEIIVQTTDTGDDDSFSGPVEDGFDLSMEYAIVIRWAVTNLTCEVAVQKNTTYACRSSHSYCLNVTHRKAFMDIVESVLPVSKETHTSRMAAQVISSSHLLQCAPAMLMPANV